MKRLLLLAMLALSFLGAASTSNIVAPLPECDPCPWVR
jgi:hypothetical protein